MSLTCPGPIYNAPAFLGTGPIYNAPAFLGAGPIYIAPAFLGALMLLEIDLDTGTDKPNTNTQRNTDIARNRRRGNELTFNHCRIS
jgi:hypothetical protein